MDSNVRQRRLGEFGGAEESHDEKRSGDLRQQVRELGRVPVRSMRAYFWRITTTSTARPIARVVGRKRRRDRGDILLISDHSSACKT